MPRLATKATMVVLLRVRNKVIARTMAATFQERCERLRNWARNTPNAQMNAMALGLKKSSFPGRKSCMVGDSQVITAMKPAPHTYPFMRGSRNEVHRSGAQQQYDHRQVCGHAAPISKSDSYRDGCAPKQAAKSEQQKGDDRPEGTAHARSTAKYSAPFPVNGIRLRRTTGG